MRQKHVTGMVATLIFLLFIIGGGCTTIREGAPVSGIQTLPATEMQTPAATPSATPTVGPKVTAAGTTELNLQPVETDGAADHDAVFNAMLRKSADEIANKTDLVIVELSQSGTQLQGGYSPAGLFLAADDLGYTTENYYDWMLKTKASNRENEMKRVEYIHFLYSAKNAANHIADAAEAESFGDYETALVMAAAAKADLAGIEYGPDLPLASRYNRLNVYLSEFVGRMRDGIVQQKTLDIIARSRLSDMSPGERFPRLPR